MTARSWPRRLAYLAIVLGVLAPFAGSPARVRTGTIDVIALATAVDREEDHVTAIELAGWIKDRKPGLRVIDVRSAAEFDAYHVPTAENLPLGAVVATSFAPTDTLVLYSEGGAHAAQAWVFLRALGYTRVLFLRGGLDDWLDEVMDPTLAADASPQEKAAFAHVAEISRYFGGVPHQASPGDPGRSSAATSAAAAARVKRRGC